MDKPRKKKNESVNAYNERASKLYYSNGYHIAEIADRLGIDGTEVYNYVSTGKKITTEAEREEMISLYNKGYSYSAIARELNRSRSCVRQRIESPAKAKWYNSNTLTDKQLKKMKEMLDDKKTIDDIAEAMGISKNSVRYRLNHMGKEIRHYKHIDAKEIKRFISLYNKGKTHAEIAEICNRSRTTVCKHLNDAGYYRKSKS